MSTSSLYSFTDNVSVSSNNYTTLYNTTTGNVVTENVPDRNFTTLYTQQSDINPTYAYGNSNVEAFLNVGSDIGGNQVQNIVMYGSLNVGGQTNLGPVSNVHISGGTNGYVLATNGSGTLAWVPASGSSGGNSTPYIHFDVVSNGNNQTFTNSYLFEFANANVVSLFKNGVNIEPFYYTLSGDVLTVNLLLSAGDTIDVLASSSGTGGGSQLPGGYDTDVQFNSNGIFGGSNSFTFNSSTSLLTVANLQVSNITNLGLVGNVKIAGGSSGQYLTTDGLGNLTWIAASGGNANTANYANFAGTAYSVSVGNVSGLGNIATLNLSGSSTDALYGNGVFAPIVSANANYANYAGNAFSVSGSNVTGTVANATYALSSGTANSATTAGSSVTAINVTASAQPNITSVGTLAISNLNISGGTSGQFLQTNGSGALTWATASGSPGGSSSQLQFNSSNTFAGASTLSFDNTTNTLTSTGNIIIQRAFEKYTTTSSGSTGTINYDVLTQSIVYDTANATANFTLNIRGNSTTTLNTILPVGDTVTMVYLNTVGTTAYIANTIQIDGSNVTPKYSGGNGPNVGVRLSNTVQSYTFTILKSAANTYSVLGSFTEYR